MNLQHTEELRPAVPALQTTGLTANESSSVREQRINLADFEADPPKVEMLAGAAYAMLPTGVAFSVYAHWQLNSFPIALLSLTVPIFLLALERMTRQNAWSEAAAEILANHAAGPEIIPDLVRGLHSGNHRLRAICSRVLAQMLSVISAADLSNLDRPIRDTLYSWVGSQPGSLQDEKISMLAALEKIADTGIIAHIQRATTHSAYTKRARNLRKAVQSCMDSVLKRDRIDKTAAEPNAGGATTVPSAETNTETAAEREAKLAAVRLLQTKGEATTSPSMRAGFLMANWFIITPYFGYQCLDAIRTDGYAPSSVLWGLVTISSVMLYKVALLPEQMRLAREAAKLSDVRAAGVLAEALTWPEIEARVTARTALIRILKLMTGDDTAILNKKQRRILDSMLTFETSSNYMDSELQLSILHAWTHVGDEASLVAVRALAAQNPTGELQTRVVVAAQQCLPHLELVAKKNELGLVLLRASSSPTETGAARELVRPAGAGDPARELLRSSHQNDQL